jgi:urate oxidase / 2-oxo-4-hydroxy-4-carboxy-5-ureidoimidazoline decarboxylase
MADAVGVSYGKGAVSVYRIEGDRLFAAEITLTIGDEVFVPSYTTGDNSMVIATDSMKNFIHKAALDYKGDTLEALLYEIAERFLDRYEHVEMANLSAKELEFQRREGAVYQRLYDDAAYAWVVSRRHGPRTRVERSGRRGLHLVKLSGSSFAGFVRDEHTTLPESLDRPLFIHMDAMWENADPEKRADGLAVRESFIRTFADFQSESIQHLVHEMGVRVLEEFPEIASISFDAENRLWDTAQTAGEATVYTDARPPYGIIHLDLER